MPPSQQLPFGNLTHNHIRDAFLSVVNIVQPEHPYKTDPYPLTKESLRYGYKQTSSTIYASCGPIQSGTEDVMFSADKQYFNNFPSERILAILVHETTHITVGSHSEQEHGSHPPRFWREVGFNSHIILDNWPTIQEVFGNVSKRDFIGYLIRDEVTIYNIDSRYGDELTQKQEMAKWFRNTLLEAK